MKDITIKTSNFILFFLFISVSAISQNLRQLSNVDGLTSNTVLSLHQDEKGILWMGTLDGLNIYYGPKLEQPFSKSQQNLSGHLVEDIIQSGNNTLWARTPHGLYRIDRTHEQLNYFQQFTGLYKIRNTGSEQILVLDKKQHLYLYSPRDTNFVFIDGIDKEIELINIGSTNTIFWTAGTNGIIRYNWMEDDRGRQYLEQPTHIFTSPINYCTESSNPEILYIVDHSHKLYMLDLQKKQTTFLFDLGQEPTKRGRISAIVEKDGSFFIGFHTGGVLKYQSTSNPNYWEKIDIGIKSGIFTILKDKLQDIIWIATDGQGVYAYWEDNYTIVSHTYKDFNANFEKPVRSFFLDEYDWLWIGTRGEGLLGIDRNFPNRSISDCPQRHLTTQNSELHENSVYTLSPSVHKGFWIGTDGGINFYDYRSRKLQKIQCSERILYVHAIQEVNDSTLWIASSGVGIFKAQIKHSPGGGINLIVNESFSINNKDYSSNFFFSMCHDSIGNLWAGNRGHGVYQISGNKMLPVNWTKEQESYLQNDVFTVLAHKGDLWAGTGFGLIGKTATGQELSFNQNNGLHNNIIHSLLPGENHEIWAATNDGIARINPTTHEIRVFSRKDGLLVTEFSDGAAFRTEHTFYFGGTNGWIEISANKNYKETKPYKPNMLFNKLKVLDKEFNLRSLIQRSDHEIKEPTIHLSHIENSFFIEFMILDLLNSSDYSYFYKLEDSNTNSHWVNNGTLRQIAFTHIPSGHYTLSVKGKNPVTGIESNIISLKLIIDAPWYATPWAKTIYWILFFLIIGFIIYYFYSKAKRRHAYTLQRMEQAHKEELYEEKLRFFTNITHEFRTPLTLILSPCERILSHENTDEFVEKYTKLIQKNAERLNTLIQEIIDYRRLETKHQQLKITNFRIDSFIIELQDFFTEWIERNEIELLHNIDNEIYWNTDPKCLSKIFLNLMSNAVKYTPKGGKIKVSLSIEDNLLVLKIYNTGKGIKDEDKLRIFNRYSVLDYVELNAQNGYSSSNGLGMAICHSMVKLLKGNIEVNSEINQYVEFIVKLPVLDLEENNLTEKQEISLSTIQNNIMNSLMPLKNLESPKLLITPNNTNAADTKKNLILAIDDNEEILFLLQEALQIYEVWTASNTDEANELIKKRIPDLIITDIMMPGTDGISYIKTIKQNKSLKHIPLIIISAKTTNEEKIEGLLFGADAYITKPFNINYLKALISRKIENHKDIIEFASSPNYTYEQNNLLLEENDQAFIHKIIEYIEDNLKEENLGIEELSTYLNISVRSMYRRFKELNLPVPRELIKEIRLNRAAQLLQTSKRTVQEIIYECGFNNRAHFYKEFSKKYNMTPRDYRTQHKLKEHDE